MIDGQPVLTEAEVQHMLQMIHADGRTVIAEDVIAWAMNVRVDGLLLQMVLDGNATITGWDPEEGPLFQLTEQGEAKQGHGIHIPVY